MVTLELAACLPVLLVVVAVALSAIGVAGAQVRAQDAAREAARSAARGDANTGRAVASRIAPGARLTVRVSGNQVVATAHLHPHLLVGWLSPVDVSAQAVAAREP